MLGAHAECEERDAFFDFAMHSQRLYKGLGEELYALSGVDIRRHNGGMFKLAFSEEDMLRLRQMDDLDSVSACGALFCLQGICESSKNAWGGDF